jgi:hypothetical protein
MSTDITTNNLVKLMRALDPAVDVLENTVLTKPIFSQPVVVLSVPEFATAAKSLTATLKLIAKLIKEGDNS